MMLIYAQCLYFLNTGSRQIRFQPRSDSERRIDRIEELKSNVIREYRLVPKELDFGANCYQAAVKAGQAGPYLLLHLQHYLQIAFLTQESLAGEEEAAAEKPPSRNITDGDRKRGLELRKVNRESYRNAIKSITDMLTFAKLIDNPAKSGIKLSLYYWCASTLMHRMPCYGCLACLRHAAHNAILISGFSIVFIMADSKRWPGCRTHN